MNLNTKYNKTLERNMKPKGGFHISQVKRYLLEKGISCKK